MAFYGCDFIFDGKRASTFLQPSNPNISYKRLMLYNIGAYGQEDVDFSVGEIVEDRINRRHDSLLYGLVQNEPLVFTLVFGIDPDDLRGETCFTRDEVAKITEWLTGHQEYKILKIVQQDMYNELNPNTADYRYHAMVTGLKLIADGGLPVAFSAEITCDSPFAYRDPLTFVQTNLSSPFRIDNQSRVHGYFYPVFDIDISGATYVELINLDDSRRTMRIDNIPSGSGLSVHIDCQNQIITTNTGYNLYPGFNMTFLRLVPGENRITINTDGTGEIRTTCEFPVNIGA